jgi:hypothetical protein
MSDLIPIGIDDFRALREQGMEYVDKSHLVRELLDKGAQVVLLPRPRRFGKSLNLSMLRCFFEKRDEDLSGLFEGLSIAEAGEGYQAPPAGPSTIPRSSTCPVTSIATMARRWCS